MSASSLVASAGARSRAALLFAALVMAVIVLLLADAPHPDLGALRQTLEKGIPERTLQQYYRQRQRPRRSGKTL